MQNASKPTQLQARFLDCSLRLGARITPLFPPLSFLDQKEALPLKETPRHPWQ